MVHSDGLRWVPHPLSQKQPTQVEVLEYDEKGVKFISPRRGVPAYKVRKPGYKEGSWVDAKSLTGLVEGETDKSRIKRRQDFICIEIKKLRDKMIPYIQELEELAEELQNVQRNPGILEDNQTLEG